MVEELDIFADLHAEFPRRHANGDFSKCAREGRSNGFAAKIFKGSNSLLSEENEGVSVHRRGDINNIGAGQVRGDSRGAALINVDGARDNSLHCDGCTDLIDSHAKATLGKITFVQSYQQMK